MVNYILSDTFNWLRVDEVVSTIDKKLTKIKASNKAFCSLVGSGSGVSIRKIEVVMSESFGWCSKQDLCRHPHTPQSLVANKQESNINKLTDQQAVIMGPIKIPKYWYVWKKQIPIRGLNPKKSFHQSWRFTTLKDLRACRQWQAFC